MSKPIAITCGDPGGIGPELTVEAWKVLKNELNFVLFSSYDYMKTSFSKIPMIRVSNSVEATNVMKDGIPIIDIPFSEQPEPGKINPKLALDIIRSINLATDSCMRGDSAALCTNPINKFSLTSGANFIHTGHTDYLKFLTKSQYGVMMLSTPSLRVVPVTVHVSLKEAINTLTETLIIDTVNVSHKALVELFNIKNPKIFLSGLNPHSGENGLFGQEEINTIKPALKVLKKNGLDIHGPFPADTMFHKKTRDTYDLAICMYHDQALIPIKTISFDEAVNVTLGLPIIRTSPDHGTAAEIADKGQANPTSFINAIRMAKSFSENKTFYANR